VCRGSQGRLNLLTPAGRDSWDAKQVSRLLAG
jgi:hypothetical protein